MALWLNRMAVRAILSTALLPLAFSLLSIPADAVRAGGVAPIEIALGGDTIALPLPLGYCPVMRGREVDEATYDRFAALLGSNKRLLLWFVDCGALTGTVDLSGASSGSLFQRYGVYLTPHDVPGAAGRFAGIARAEFAKAVARTMPALDIEVLVAEIRGRWQTAGSYPPGAAGSERVGAFAHDRDAYYLAIVDHAAARDRGGVQAGIVGGTLIHGHSISAMLYRSVSAADTLYLLRRDTEALMKALLAANPDSDTAGQGWRIDGNRLALWGLKIGLIFIAIGIVNFLWKFWCRRRGIVP
jgi:hypothetical protein